MKWMYPRLPQSMPALWSSVAIVGPCIFGRQLFSGLGTQAPGLFGQLGSSTLWTAVGIVDLGCDSVTLKPNSALPFLLLTARADFWTDRTA